MEKCGIILVSGIVDGIVLLIRIKKDFRVKVMEKVLDMKFIYYFI